MGLFTKKLHVEEGDFNKKKVGVFALANVIANLIGWIVVAPVLDILIYAEPAKKVFAQGVFAGISNSITAVVVGACWCWLTPRPLPRKALWIKNNAIAKPSRGLWFAERLFCLPLCRWERRHRNILL